MFSPLSIWFLLGLILLVVVGLALLFLGVIVAGSFVNVPLCTMR